MAELPLSSKAEELLQKMLLAWPAIIRGRWREKLMIIANLHAAANGEKEISADTLLNILNVWPFSEHSWVIKGTLLHLGLITREEMFRGREAVLKPTIRFWSTDESNKIKIAPSGKTKVAAILGSPRKGGNTDIIIDELLKGAESAGAEVEKVHLNKLNIRYCTGCDKCRDKSFKGFCSLKDDMTPVLYKQFLECDVLIVGFPIYTGRESAVLANYHDRLYGLGSFPWMFEGKKRRGALVVTWGAPNARAFERIIDHHVSLMSWYGVTVEEAVYGSGCTEKGIIAQDKEGLQKTFEAGKRLVMV